LNVERLKELKALINEFGISADSQSAFQIEKYRSLLEKWNARINLTAATEWRAVEPLFREGIWASKIYPAGTVSHLDIGTGAGFPAIILKILNPHMRLEMVESRAKKGAFLETVVHELGLSNTLVHVNRLDTFLQNIFGIKFWDCITWKGLKLNRPDLDKLIKHAHSDTQFWMFHGKETATENPEMMENLLQNRWREKMPAMKEWYLSIYVLRK
jgi:16S rRNA (guanine(527)-N(7))-methyltransferase RsmG